MLTFRSPLTGIDSSDTTNAGRREVQEQLVTLKPETFVTFF